MVKITPVHIVVAVLLVLFSLAIVHWVILPKGGLPAPAEFSEETGQLEELPVLPQNELYNSPAALSVLKNPPPFQESKGQDLLEPKDPVASSRKAEL
ncbi:MAG: hypothetical protein V1882_05545 [Candidatus Omnitrophota bacterium]